MSTGDSLDPDALRRLETAGGHEFVRAMIDLFLTHAPARVTAISAGIQDGNLGAARGAAHSLKSTAATVGALDVAELAGRIEVLAGRQEVDALSGLASALERAFRATRTRLEEVRSALE
ncbi:MAG: Hpt domain-containing protein [Gemmatimonadetes bacterium]|nr:Hpt domain-containing protein [Gemmatimonadota bacterium]